MEVNKIKKWLGAGSINVFGMPYAGKDTQCRRLAELFGAEVIGGGDISRSSGSIELRKQSEAGFLAPTDEFLDLVKVYLDQRSGKSQPLILNSLGRWHGEEETILKAALDAGHAIKVAIYIKIEVDEIRRRWQLSQSLGDRGKRADDAADVLENRLNEFNDKTLPVIEFYRNNGLLIEVDGEKTTEEVTNQILEALEFRI